MTNNAFADTTGASKIQAEFFVSPSGSDSNPGTYEKPLATLDGARKAVETINGNMSGDIYVFFEPGTYYTPNTVNFTTADSGTNGHHVIYKTLGAPGSATFVGGMKVTSVWSQVQTSTDPNNPDSDMWQNLIGKVYKTNLIAQLGVLFPSGLPATSGPLPNNPNGKFDVNTLYVNDARVTQARTLNSNKYPGYPSTLLENPLYSAGGTYSSMQYKAGDANNIYVQALTNAQTRADLSVQIVGNDIGNGRSWDSNTLPVQSINTTTRTLTFNPNDTGKWSAADGEFASFYSIGANSRYFLQGNLAFLDTPGEFYYNAKSGDLYYYPTSEQTDLNAQDIVVPTTESIVNILGNRTGTWDSTVITPVKNITFDGLGFKDTSFPDYYSPNWPWLQYGSGVRGYAFPSYAANSTNPIYSGQSERPQFQVGNITIENADSITITNAHIKNAGMNGVILKTGVTNSVVKNSLIEYCGINGVDIQGGFPGVDGTSNAVSFTNHNLIENNVIHDLGQLVLQASGVAINNATSNTVSHIEIYNSPRRAILLNSSDVQGWNNTGPSGARNYSPTAYVLSRDQYGYDNKFSYIYIHHVQQDGNDDGAFMTAFLYYPGDNYSRPNYINQMVIDHIAANPQLSNQGMTNITPNNINFDMGWVGLEVSNVKSVNPQHYNIENDHLQDGQVKVTNSNFYFKDANDGLSKFDDSKMDYANIGVLSRSFPSEYAQAMTKTKADVPSDVYFGDNFESGINLGQWNYSGALPTISRLYMSEGGFNGTSSLEINSSGASKPVLYRNFSNKLNKNVSVKIFDNSSTDHTTYGTGYPITYAGRTFVRADDGTNIVGLGIDPSSTNGGQYYVMNIGGVTTATNVLRTTGWHTLSLDYSTPGTIALSVDGTVVNTLNSSTWANTPNSFNYVSLGSPDGTGDNFYDQFYIYGGQDAPAAQPIVPSGGTIPPYTPGSGSFINWDFESSSMPVPQSTTSSTGPTTLNANGFTNFFNGNLSVVENPQKANSGNPYTTDTSNKAMYISGGVSLYAPQPLPTWSNYTYNINYMLNSWTGTAIHDMLGFNVYQQQPTNNNLQYNPATYQVALVRNKAGTGNNYNLPNNGSPYLLIRQINPSMNLASLQLPASFADTSVWHTLSVSLNNGNISATLDGQYTTSAQTNTFTSGTFGFYTFNCNAYFDNISVAPNQPDMVYDANLKLGNATLNGAFNPDYTTYTAAITDITQPVTLVMPTAATTGTTYSISLNGKDITSSFPDTSTPVALALVHGTNTLTITQITLSGSITNYTVSILKPYSSATADPIAPISTTVGTGPALPAKATVHFDDGGTEQFAINWNIVDKSIINNPGTYSIYGKLSGIGLQVSASISVEGLESMGKLDDVSTIAGTVPVFPQTINAQFTNESRDLALTFAEFDPAMYARAGTIIAVARVDQYAFDVLQKVKVLPGQPTEAFTLSMNQPSYSLTIGDTQPTVVTATYKDSSVVQDVTSLAVFATADGKVASVDNKGVLTGIAEGSTTISASYGGETVTAQVLVTKRDAQQTGVQLTAPASVLKGDSFTVRLGLKQVHEPIFAQDMLIQYDPNLYEFQDAVPVHEGLTVYKQPSKTPGQIRLILVSLGTDHAITSDADVVELKFAAKQVPQSASGSIAVTSATIGDAHGQESQALPASVTVEVTAAIELPGDVNHDNKYSIADLAIAAAHYGMTQQHPEWSKFKSADVDSNGVIDIVDLAAIAKKIIEA